MISKEQKTNLAKLLATENITVEHKKVETAYFIPKTRILCLPLWEDMSNDLYDLLVGHEVGHALYTPTDENEFKKHKGIPHSYFNVIEDIRIDKKMKIKYPGLRRSYYRGYNELIENDFFRTKDINIDGLRFIDRLNMFSKSGQRELIEFNDTEKEFITRSDKLETWDDVVKLTKDIFAYSQEEQFDEDEQEQLAMSKSMTPDMQEGEDNSEQEQEGDSNEQQEQDQETSSSSGSDTDKPEDEQSNNSSNKQEDKKEEQEKVKSQSSSNQESGYDPSANESFTDKNFSETSKKLSNTSKDIADNHYVTLPKRVDNVVTVKEIAKDIDKYNSRYPMSLRLSKFKQFKKDQMRTVNYMVKEFEMKKSADAYTRTRTARTGMINTNSLHSYKYNDDIFKRINIEPGAKNHGMIMIIDWSGSMHDKMYNTIIQTMNLVMFCKAVNIPFEVYAFSDIAKQYFQNDEDYDGFSRRYKNLPVILDKPNQIVMENCSMLQFVTSDLRTNEYNEAMSNLLAVANYYQVGSRSSRYLSYSNDEPYFDIGYTLRLGGTPLDSGILSTIEIANKFQKKNKIQKLNTVFLTDGCGHTTSNYTALDDKGNISVTYLNNQKFKIKDGSYTIDYGSDSYGQSHFITYHKPMLEYYKHKTGSTVIGYYIAGRTLKYWDINTFTGKSNYQLFEDAKSEMRKNKCVTMKNNGYDELFIITQNNLKIEDEEVNITTDMTTAKMKSQFLKNFKSKKLSRVLLNKFVERVA